MNTNVSRRAAILGTLASTAALAMPVAAAKSRPSELAAAMAAHRACDEALDPLLAEVEAAEARLRAMGQDRAPEVHIGNLRGAAFDKEGNWTTTPIMATTHEEITASFERHAAVSRPWAETVPFYRKTLANLQAKFDGYHAELDRLQSARTAAMAETGYTAAREALDAARATERQLGARVVLARPVKPEEAEAKRAYLTEFLFEDWDIMAEILAASVEL